MCDWVFVGFVWLGGLGVCEACWQFPYDGFGLGCCYVWVLVACLWVALLGCLGLFSLTCYSGVLVFYWFLGLVLVLFNCDLGLVALLLCYLCWLVLRLLLHWFELGF